MPDGFCARTPLTRARAIAVASPKVSASSRAWASRSANDDFLVGAVGAPQLGSVNRPDRSLGRYAGCPWQCLYFLPDPHGHGALRLTGASTTPPSPSRCGIGGCGMLSSGMPGERRAAAGVDVGGVVLGRERIDVLGDEVGQHRLRRLLELDLRLHQDPRHFLADRDQQPLEQQEGLLLIFVDRLLLRVAPKVDHLAQRIERREMLLPVMVEGLDQDLLFDIVPALRVDFAELGRHRFVGEVLKPLDDHLGLDRFLLQPLFDRRLQAEDRLDALRQALRRPIARDRCLRGNGRRRSPATVSARISVMTSLTLSASMMSARCS